MAKHTIGARALFAIVCVAASARWLFIGAESYWFDEIWALQQVRLPLSDLLGDLRRSDVHPPLYPLLLWAWVRIGGEGEIWVRSLSALFGVGAVLATYSVGARLHGRRIGLTAAGLIALHTFAVEYAQEARAYSLLLLLAAASTSLLVRWVADPSLRRALTYGAVSVGLAYSHVYGLFVLMGQALWFVAARPAPWRQGLGVATGVGLAFAPWVPVLLEQAGRVQSGFWIAPPRWSDAIVFPWTWAGYNPVVLVLFVGLAAVAARRYRAGTASSVPRPGTLLLAVGATPVVVPLLVSLVSQPIFVAKYAIALVAPLCVAVAVGLDALAFRTRRVVTGVLIAALVVGLPAALYLPTQKEQWRELAVWARDRASEGYTLVADAHNDPYLRYYLPDVPIVWAQSEADATGRVCWLMVHPPSSSSEQDLRRSIVPLETHDLRGARGVCYDIPDSGGPQ